jgi:hypothetical protein
MLTTHMLEIEWGYSKELLVWINAGWLCCEEVVHNATALIDKRNKVLERERRKQIQVAFGEGTERVHCHLWRSALARPHCEKDGMQNQSEKGQRELHCHLWRSALARPHCEKDGMQNQSRALRALCTDWLAISMLAYIGPPLVAFKSLGFPAIVAMYVMAGCTDMAVSWCRASGFCDAK